MARLLECWSYDQSDPSLVLFTAALKAWDFDIPDGARVLELGCCESDWAARLKRTRPNCYITGIDVRPCPDYGGDHIILGDASSYPWEPESFDWVVGLGSVEHFGLGWQEYGDPVKPMGDALAIASARRALKPGGQLYFDVPWTPQAMFQTEHWRCYDDEGLRSRLLPGFEHLARGWAPNERESELTRVRPGSPYAPFWFVAVWGRKAE